LSKSTRRKAQDKAELPSSRGLGRRPLKAETAVRIRSGVQMDMHIGD
jgi:hypothetical protein